MGLLVHEVVPFSNGVTGAMGAVCSELRTASPPRERGAARAARGEGTAAALPTGWLDALPAGWPDVPPASWPDAPPAS